MSSWILDLSSSTINVLSVRRGGADRWHQIELPAEVYAHGFINRPENAGSLLKAELKRAGLQVSAATVILPPMASYEMQVKLPAAVSRRELPGAVTSAAGRATAGQLKDAVLAWARLEKGPVSQSVFFAAARRDAVQTAADMCRHAGIRVKRILPYFLAVSQTLGSDLGVLVLTSPDRHATVLAVEHGAPVLTGGLGPFVPGFGAESMLASALQAALAAAGPDSPLVGTTRLYLLGEDADLAESLRGAGYEVWMVRRPREQWPDRIPWPAAAAAWGGALCERRELAGLSLADARRPKSEGGSKAPLAAALLVATAVHLIGYGYFEGVSWPGARRRIETEKADVARVWSGLQEQKREIDRLALLRQQHQKLLAQNASLPPQFDWMALYRSVIGTLPPGAELRELTLENVVLPGGPGAPGGQAPGQQPPAAGQPQPAAGQAQTGAGQAQTPSAPDPVVVVMGRVSGLDVLTALTERLKQPPFSSPHVDSLRLEPGRPDAPYQFVVRARYAQPQSKR